MLITVVCAPLNASDDEVSDRIDFSSARIMGQANDFGAVYLMHRKQNDMTSMLSIRSNYRLEILFDLQYLPIDEETGLVLLPQPFGEDEYEAGFEPVEAQD
jgi:hypothetical protein